jgi:31-O-methyltransferase
MTISAAFSPGPRLVGMPGGPRVWCTNPAEAVMLWRELTPGSAYATAAARLPAGSTVLDVGANIGLTSLYCRQVQPDLRIVAVEPVPDVFDCLRRNLAQHVPRWDASCVALSDGAGVAELTYYPSASCNSGLAADRVAEDANSRVFLSNSGLDGKSIDALVPSLHVGVDLQVPTATVAQLVRDYEIGRIGLLKVDVEGAELRVLSGLDEASWAIVDQVAVEVHDDDGRLARITAMLRAHGLHVTVRQDPLLAGTNLYDVAAGREPRPQP